MSRDASCSRREGRKLPGPVKKQGSPAAAGSASREDTDLSRRKRGVILLRPPWGRIDRPGHQGSQEVLLGGWVSARLCGYAPRLAALSCSSAAVSHAICSLWGLPPMRAQDENATRREAAARHFPCAAPHRSGSLLGNAVLPRPPRRVAGRRPDRARNADLHHRPGRAGRSGAHRAGAPGERGAGRRAAHRDGARRALPRPARHILMEPRAGRSRSFPPHQPTRHAGHRRGVARDAGAHPLHGDAPRSRCRSR